MGPLTLYQQLPLDERLRSDLVGVLMKKKMSISDKLEGLFKICGESQSFRIAPPHQTLIYQTLIKSVTNDTPADIESLSLDIWKWAKIIGHCKPCTKQSDLLAHEVKLVAQAEYIDPAISGYVLGKLPSFHQLSQSTTLLEKLLSHLKAAHQYNEEMNILVIHSAISSLKHIDLTTEMGQEIARELTWHINQNTAAKAWFNSVPRSYVISDLSKVKFTDDIKELVEALLPHVQHNDKILKKEYELIVKGLEHMPAESPIVQSIKDALSPPVELEEIFTMFSSSEEEEEVEDERSVEEISSFVKEEVNADDAASIGLSTGSKKRARTDRMNSSLEDFTAGESSSSSGEEVQADDSLIPISPEKHASMVSQAKKVKREE